MVETEQKQIGQEITFQYVETICNFIVDFERKYPEIKLESTQPGKGSVEQAKTFREAFERYHDKAREEFVKGHPRLDCHKLAAIAIVAVLKIHPLQEWRGEYRTDNFANETLAILLANKIMLNVRIFDYNKKYQGCEETVYSFNRFLFPSRIFDELTPMHRFRLLLANLNLEDGNLVSNIRNLAYHCYQFDSRQRLLIDGQLKPKSA